MQTAPSAVVYSKLSDLELAQSIASGDKAAFELLMRRNNQMLYRTARSILKDEAEAEDSVQDAYLLAYRGMSSFRGDAKLSTWLVRIVVNEAIARARKRSRGAEIIQLSGETQDDSEAAGEHMNETLPEQPEHAAQRAQTRRLLEAKIDELPDAFRTVFVLRALEELTVEESAVVLGIPEATVRSRFFRARGLLREALSKEIDIAYSDAFAFAGARCDRIVAGVMARLAESGNTSRS
ncbi:MAG TPA: RNA polymerase sigma factor [Burkholderiales bacterium]|nr:RNA polymerase sigma factor [Burkholderiales bacterium]